MRVVDDLGGHGTEEDALERAVLARPDDDELCGRALGLFEDHRGGTALEHALGDGQTRPAQSLGGVIDPSSAVVDEPLVHLGRLDIGADGEHAAVDLDLRRGDADDLEA